MNDNTDTDARTCMEELRDLNAMLAAVDDSPFRLFPDSGSGARLTPEGLAFLRRQVVPQARKAWEAGEGLVGVDSISGQEAGFSPMDDAARTSAMAYGAVVGVLALAAQGEVEAAHQVLMAMRERVEDTYHALHRIVGSPSVGGSPG